jgi:hypothetical protein
VGWGGGGRKEGRGEERGERGGDERRVVRESYCLSMKSRFNLLLCALGIIWGFSVTVP